MLQARLGQAGHSPLIPLGSPHSLDAAPGVMPGSLLPVPHNACTEMDFQKSIATQNMESVLFYRCQDKHSDCRFWIELREPTR